MKDFELSARGKAAYGVVCAACCGIPMAVLLGLVSLGTAAAAGVSFGAAATVVFLAYVVARHRAGWVSPVTRRGLGVGGGVLSIVGLSLAGTSPSTSATVVAVAVSLLASAALLALAENRGARSSI